jgi:hypothetical protein
MIDAVMYGEIPNDKIEKLDNPPPEKVFKIVKKSLLRNVFLIPLISINGTGINVQILNTNKIRIVKAKCFIISGSLKIFLNFSIINYLDLLYRTT